MVFYVTLFIVISFEKQAVSLELAKRLKELRWARLARANRAGGTPTRAQPARVGRKRAGSHSKAPSSTDEM